MILIMIADADEAGRLLKKSTIFYFHRFPPLNESQWSQYEKRSLFVSKSENSWPT